MWRAIGEKKGVWCLNYTWSLIKRQAASLGITTAAFVVSTRCSKFSYEFNDRLQGVNVFARDGLIFDLPPDFCTYHVTKGLCVQAGGPKRLVPGQVQARSKLPRQQPCVSKKNVMPKRADTDVRGPTAAARGNIKKNESKK